MIERGLYFKKGQDHEYSKEKNPYFKQEDVMWYTTEKQIQDYLWETAAAGEQCVCERIFSTGSED